jgi:hypothetical protein
MVEDSKRRGRAHKGSGPASAGHNGRGQQPAAAGPVAAADQAAFAAFTSKYRCVDSPAVLSTCTHALCARIASSLLGLCGGVGTY